MKLLHFLLINLLVTHILFAQTDNEGAKTTGTKPVDEGIKSIHQEDKTKAPKDINNTFEYKKKSLSDIKKYLYIKRKNINHAPFKCLYLDGKNNKIRTLFVEKQNLNSINFKIEKSLLKVNDAIIVINNKDSKENQTGKEAIIQIDIVK
ncbi:MAG: Unknown protein [uncultured Sulfurovum sp.]|uniref:Periplasmic protein n=1 Tax=uncultured Sulfurovum sp. TaxID=269237 RepID=A0A6S6SPR8_9BACT|nr:MAG: Unknown protein [uncultured Sulfurovum sp.]